MGIITQRGTVSRQCDRVSGENKAVLLLGMQPKHHVKRKEINQADMTSGWTLCLPGSILCDMCLCSPSC